MNAKSTQSASAARSNAAVSIASSPVCDVVMAPDNVAAPD
jgi:hypothetical protein